MINREQFKKIGDKKKLHKVRKRWLVVSTALLGAIGMGAVSSMPTHADTVNSPATNTQAQAKPQQNAPQPSATSTSKAVAGTQQPQQSTTIHSNAPQFTNDRNIAVSGVDTSVPESIWTNQSISSTAQETQQQNNNGAYTATGYSSENNNTYQSQQRFNNNTQSSVTSYSSVNSYASLNTLSTSYKASSTGYTNRPADMSISSASLSNSTQQSSSISESTNTSELKNDHTVLKSLINSYGNVQYAKPVNHLSNVLKDNTWSSKLNLRKPLKSVSSINKMDNPNSYMSKQSLKNIADHLSDVIHHNTWHNQHVAAMGYHLESSNDNDSSIVNVVGNPVTYKGSVSLHFHNYKGDDIKDLTVPYSVSSEVGNQVTILDPDKFLNTNIQGFNTNGYKADDDSSDFTHTILGKEGVNPSGNVITKDYTLNFTKTSPDIDTDMIHYIYNGQQVGSTTMSGNDGSKGTVNGSNLGSKYKLANDATDSFTFDKGTHNADVMLAHPQPPQPKPTPKPNTPAIDTDMISYLYNGQQVGSTTVKGDNGTKGTINEAGLNQQYKLASNADTSFTFDNGKHTIDVVLSHPQPQPKPKPTPKPQPKSQSNSSSSSSASLSSSSSQPVHPAKSASSDTDTIEYMYNNQQVGSSVAMRGTNGNYGIAGVDLPSGYKLADDGTQNFTYDDGTHRVNVTLVTPLKPDNHQNVQPAQPEIDTDVIDYVYANKVLGSTVMRGQNGITATADGTNVPNGYHMANDGSSSFAYDNGTHYVTIQPNTSRATDTISLMYNGKSIGSFMLTGQSDTSVDFSSIMPKGYQLANDASDKVSYDGQFHNVDIKPVTSSPTVQSSKIILNYVNADTGATIHTNAINGADGSQFNYQQFENLVPVGGYSFVRISNPIAQFTDQVQVMTILVKPITSSSKAGNSVTASSNAPRSAAPSSVNSSNESMPTAQKIIDNVAGQNGNNPYNPYGYNGPEVSGMNGSYTPNNDVFNAPAPLMPNNYDTAQPNVNYQDTSTGTGAGESDTLDRDYQRAYRYGYEDAKDGQIRYTRGYMMQPTAYLRGYQSYEYSNGQGLQDNTSIPETNLSENNTGDATNVPTDTSTDSTDEMDASTTGASGNGSYYLAPAVGSLWDGQYQIYEDQNGEYIIVDGIKLYWDPSDGQFDLVLTDNGFQKYNIAALGL